MTICMWKWKVGVLLYGITGTQTRDSKILDACLKGKEMGHTPSYLYKAQQNLMGDRFSV